MSSTIHLFSILAERIGRRKLDIELTRPVRAGELLDHLAGAHEAISDFRSVIRLAVNYEYVDESDTVHPGDELALITPTSGG